jgi:3-oxoacyl-[acyl-carrier-protein] synthase III
VTARIVSVGSYAPERRMSNDELARIVDTSDEWIYSHTGIRYRHIAEDSQATSDLALPAAWSALKRARLDPADLDMIVLATSTPDYIGLPSTACVVQDKLGAYKAGAMDVMAVCTGFIYALETARAFITAGTAQNVLVIGSEVYSKILNWKDRNTCVLFGDGAGAVVVAPAAQGSPSSIGISILRSDGSGAESLMRARGGTRSPSIPGATPEAETRLSMDGRRVYNFAVKVMTETIEQLLERHGMAFEDLAWVVPHQANSRIIDAACKRKGWDRSRFYMNMDEYANTSAASIPLALDEMQSRSLLKPGDPVIVVGFGAGLTWGGSLIRW